ncbi:alanine dehydrogenase [Varunaivibrio sulfuroxidans]|uniref:Alanine dehydrogenase n=1 Tax=Varunaivibrio sulfuroxidans TaxID=1773489 RepID=A0A4R3JFG5_9PROT|nr:alanine dehydrogenase [Varunaivibrio sulfuroxidans]TCS63420.1 L-alanine dehydrogenase [Varunaivibrio sulfuroxidans]WES30434.1 alanine dehydrogenase [Varunaivibrio sulfuroxidans]
MLIGVPKEIKNHEYRVGLTPTSVREFVAHGHAVMVETNAGVGIGCNDEDYVAAGAAIAADAKDVFAKAEMIVKVKEPQAVERKMLREGQLLFTYLHLAPDPDQTRDLVDSGAVCVAYETVTDSHGGLPLLAPMSQVAGRMSVQAGAHSLERAHGGRGMLLGGVPGVEPAKVVVIGGGVVGENAIYMALGQAADVTVLDRNVNVLSHLTNRFGAALKTVYSTREALERHVLEADMVVGAVLVAGAEAPKLVSAEMVKAMKPGSVLVDVAIDQGGCFATSHATTHADPTYIVDDVVHYCVANMPGAVPRTSTYALNNATLPFGLALADKGYAQALLDDAHLLAGLNVIGGKVTYKAVADDLGYDYTAPRTALGA